MADAEPEPEAEPLMLGDRPGAAAAAPAATVDAAAEPAESAEELTEMERIHAAVSALLLESPEAGAKTVVKAMKAAFPGSELVNTKCVREAMAAHKAQQAAEKRCSAGHLFGPRNPLARNRCDECGSIGTAYRCDSGCDWDLCEACYGGHPPTAAEIAASRAAAASRDKAVVDRIKATAKLAKGYGEFFNHISLRKEWRTVPFALPDVQSFFSAAAAIVIGLRGELDAATPGVVKLRMLDGSAKEYLWGVESNPNPAEHTPAENQTFVSELVHATMKDANGYVEELTKERVDGAVATHGGRSWPWVGDEPLPASQGSLLAPPSTASSGGSDAIDLRGLRTKKKAAASAATSLADAPAPAATPLAGLFDATPGVISSALALNAAARAAGGDTAAGESNGGQERHSAGLGTAPAAGSARKLVVARASDDENDEAVDAALATNAASGATYTNGAIDLD
jgi:hypothetical protein